MYPFMFIQYPDETTYQLVVKLRETQKIYDAYIPMLKETELMIEFSKSESLEVQKKVLERRDLLLSEMQKCVVLKQKILFMLKK